MNIPRRTFLQGAALALGGTVGLKGALTAPRKRPNILVISTDQQFADAMSCAGNPHVHTPAMDSLAARGVMFERAYCSNPICVPSRASYMTGLMPHETGVRFNANQVTPPMKGECLGRYFRDAGYATGHVGKWHIPRPITDQAWSGFDYLAAVRNNRVDPEIPGAAETFLRQDRGDQPFLLFTSFLNPHDICEWARLASGIDTPLPNGPIPPAPPPGECPPLIANHRLPTSEPSVIREHQAMPGNRGTYPTRTWGGTEDGRWRQYLWAYYRMTEAVDAHIARILKTLKEIGEEENTVIVFFSDHGDGMGAHRWNQKTLFYDEVARVPFIVAWPGRTKPAGRERGRLVNLGTDLAATLFDFAGIPQPAGLRGLSVKSFALGERDGPRHDYVVSENNLHPGYGSEGEHHGRMVRTARHKYVCYNGGENPEQLFDLELDPGEMTNLAGSPDHADLLRQHRELLGAYIRETHDYFPGPPPA